jgi:predicted Zn-dependent protease
MRDRVLPMALAAALLAGCATVTNPVTGQREITVMDERSEIAEGRKAHEEVLQDYGVYASPRLQAYVNELGQRLAKQSHRKNLEWHFTVLDSPEVNAFALPGGYVYVTRGLMAYMESEADLAGVIGHEIGHVTARHGAQRATRQQTAGLGVLAATVLGAVLEVKGVSGATDIASTLSQGVAAGYIASYSRDQETQADKLGAEYLARNNYDPKNMIDVIRVLKSQEQYAADTARAEGRKPPAGAGWLASHPSNDKRLQDIAQFAAQYKGKYGDEGRARYLQAIDGMTFGESREQGVTRGRNFFHEPLGIALTAPEGWKVQNSRGGGGAGERRRGCWPDRAGGAAEGRQCPRRHHSQRLQARAGPYRAAGAGQLPGDSFRRRRPQSAGTGAGDRGHRGDRTGQPAFPAVLWRPGCAGARPRPRARLREAEASFRALSVAEKAAARPWVLRSVPYQKGSFAQLAQKSPLSGNAEAQLRLLNGLYAGGEPPPGQPIKIVE